MSKSPLAGAFAEGSTPEKKKKKKGAALLIIAGIGLTASVGGVLAANSITINGGNDIEFGQGIAGTNACVDALDTEMTQVFDSTNSSSDAFDLDDVILSGDFTDCANKTLVVRLIDVAGATISGDVELDVAASGGDIATSASSHTITTFGGVLAGEVEAITITTK